MHLVYTNTLDKFVVVNSLSRAYGEAEAIGGHIRSFATRDEMTTWLRAMGIEPRYIR